MNDTWAFIGAYGVTKRFYKDGTNVKYGPIEPANVHARLREMATVFLKETQGEKEKKKELVRT
jgi:hypothetical protein